MSTAAGPPSVFLAAFFTQHEILWPERQVGDRAVPSAGGLLCPLCPLALPAGSVHPGPQGNPDLDPVSCWSAAPRDPQGTGCPGRSALLLSRALAGGGRGHGVPVPWHGLPSML